MIIPFFASKFGNLRLRPQRPTGSLADLTSDFAFTFGPFAMHANIYRVTFAAADLPIRSSICFYELECSVLIVLDFPQIKIIIKPAGSSPVPVSPPFLLQSIRASGVSNEARDGIFINNLREKRYFFTSSFFRVIVEYR